MRLDRSNVTGGALLRGFFTIVVLQILAALLLFGAAGFITINLLLPLLFQNPNIIEATPNDAAVRFEIAHPITGFDGCTRVSWEVDGVQTVAFGVGFRQPDGVIGTDSRLICPEQDTFVTLIITLPDNNVYRYQSDVLISPARTAPVHIILVMGLIALGGLTLTRPDRIMRLAYRNGQASHTERMIFAAMLIVVFMSYLPAKFIVYGGDYEVHVYYAHQVANGAPLTSPHFINQFLMIGMAWLLPGDMTTPDIFFDAQFWVNQIFLLLTAGLFYAFLRSELGAPASWQAAILLTGLTLGVMIAAPLFFHTLGKQELFMGYIPTSNMFHNPTYTLMRPMSVMLVWMGIRIFRGTVTRPVWVGIAAAATIVLSLITKPNHAIIFIPAVGLFMLWDFVRERRVRPLAAVFIAAALPVLLLQFTAFFTDADVQRFTEPSQVIFAPFAAMLTRETNYTMMGVKLLLSSAFPLLIAVSYFHQVRRYIPLTFTWAAYVVGLVFAYTLAEQGKIQHANFIFSAQIGLDMVMLASVAWLFRQPTAERDPRWTVALVLFVLHVAAGVVWHAVNVASAYGFAWWGNI